MMRPVSGAALLLVAAWLFCSGAQGRLDPATDRKLLEQALQIAVFQGVDAPKGRYPYYVSLRTTSTGTHFCGGSVIRYGTAQNPGALSGKIVLTAAHCFENGDAGVDDAEKNPVVLINPWYNPLWGAADSNKIVGQFPVADYTDATVHRTVYGTWVHPSYNFLSGPSPGYAPQTCCPSRFENDIALMLLDSQIGPPGQTLPTIAMPDAGTPKAASTGTPPGLPANTDLTLIGMGLVDQTFLLGIGKPSRALQEGHPVTLQSNGVCVGQDLGSGDSWTPFSNNTRICAGKVGTGPNACGGDSGGPLFQRGANWAADKQIGLTSYGVDDKYPITGLPSSPCNKRPLVYTDLAVTRAWIGSTIQTLQNQFNEFTIDMYFVVKGTTQAYPNEIPVPALFELSKFLSRMIGKKPAGDSPFQVNYYSQKNQAAGAPATGSMTRLRYKWTSKKTWESVSSFLNTGSYTIPCNKSPTEWENGKPDCASGPFSTQQMTVCPGIVSKLFCTPTKKPTYFRHVANSIENILIENIDPFFNRAKLTLKAVQVSNGYSPPNCVNGVSDYRACKRQTAMLIPPAA